MDLEKVQLPLLKNLRKPTFLEKILCGVHCIGFCQDNNDPDMIAACWQHCFAEKQITKFLPEKT